MLLQGMAQEVHPIGAGHAYIADGESVISLVQHLKSAGGIRALVYMISRLAKKGAQHMAQGGLVVNYEDLRLFQSHALSPLGLVWRRTSTVKLLPAPGVLARVISPPHSLSC